MEGNGGPTFHAGCRKASFDLACWLSIWRHREKENEKRIGNASALLFVEASI